MCGWLWTRLVYIINGLASNSGSHTNILSLTLPRFQWSCICITLSILHVHVLSACIYAGVCTMLSSHYTIWKTRKSPLLQEETMWAMHTGQKLRFSHLFKRMFCSNSIYHYYFDNKAWWKTILQTRELKVKIYYPTYTVKTKLLF